MSIRSGAQRAVRRAVLPVFALLTGCVTFLPGERLTAEPPASWRLGRETIIQALGLRDLRDTSGVAIRVLVEPFPEYGFAIFDNGEVRYVGGFGVMCVGTLRRKVDVPVAAELVGELRQLRLPESRFEGDPYPPSDSAEIRLGFRTGAGGWHEVLFRDAMDHESLMDAMRLVQRAVGVQHLTRTLDEPDVPNYPQNCSHRSFLF